MRRALIGTGFPYRENRRWLKAYLAMLESVMQATAGLQKRFPDRVFGAQAMVSPSNSHHVLN
jgi:hypothetical protein